MYDLNVKQSTELLFLAGELTTPQIVTTVESTIGGKYVYILQLLLCQHGRICRDSMY